MLSVEGCPERSGLKREGIRHECLTCTTGIGHSWDVPLAVSLPCCETGAEWWIEGGWLWGGARDPHNSSVWHPQARTGTSAPGTPRGSAAVTPRPGRWRR